jgi:hypothetical protein
VEPFDLEWHGAHNRREDDYEAQIFSASVGVDCIFGLLFAFGYLHVGVGAYVDCARKPDGVSFPMTDYLMQSAPAMRDGRQRDRA